LTVINKKINFKFIKVFGKDKDDSDDEDDSSLVSELESRERITAAFEDPIPAQV